MHAPATRRCSLGLVNRLYRFIRRGAGGSVPKRISVCTMRLILDAAISSKRLISVLKSCPDWAEGAWTLTVRIVRHADSRGREEASGLVSDAASRASAMRESQRGGGCSGQPR